MKHIHTRHRDVSCPASIYICLPYPRRRFGIGIRIVQLCNYTTGQLGRRQRRWPSGSGGMQMWKQGVPVRCLGYQLRTKDSQVPKQTSFFVLKQRNKVIFRLNFDGKYLAYIMSSYYLMRFQLLNQYSFPRNPKY